MSQHVDRRPLRRSLRAALVLLVATMLLMGGRATFAFFTDSATVTSNGIAAGAVGTPSITSVAAAGTGVKISWSATPVGATVAQGYVVTRYPTSSGGTGTVICRLTSPTLSCTDNAPASGTAYYDLTATFAANWTNTSARKPYVAAAGPPTGVRCTSAGFFGFGSFIEWDAPSGVSPDSYLVSYSRNGGAVSTTPDNDTTWRPSGTGFSNGTYTVQIASVTNGVPSALSSTSASITRSALGYSC